MSSDFPEPPSGWSPDPADYSSRAYLDHQLFLAELRSRARDEARSQQLDLVRRSLKDRAVRKAAAEAGEPYVEPGEPI